MFSSKPWLLTCCQQRIRYGIKNCKICDIVNVSPKPFPGIFIIHRRLVLFWRRPFLFLIIIKGVSSALSHPFLWCPSFNGNLRTWLRSIYFMFSNFEPTSFIWRLVIGKQKQEYFPLCWWNIQVAWESQNYDRNNNSVLKHLDQNHQ